MFEFEVKGKIIDVQFLNFMQSMEKVISIPDPTIMKSVLLLILLTLALNELSVMNMDFCFSEYHSPFTT